MSEKLDSYSLNIVICDPKLELISVHRLSQAQNKILIISILGTVIRPSSDVVLLPWRTKFGKNLVQQALPCCTTVAFKRRASAAPNKIMKPY